MHPPYHLYEFGLFWRNGQQNGYTVAHHRFLVCQTYMPKIVDPIMKRNVNATDTGMQLEVWLRKKSLCHKVNVNAFPQTNDE